MYPWLSDHLSYTSEGFLELYKNAHKKYDPKTYSFFHLKHWEHEFEWGYCGICMVIFFLEHFCFASTSLETSRYNGEQPSTRLCHCRLMIHYKILNVPLLCIHCVLRFPHILYCHTLLHTTMQFDHDYPIRTHLQNTEHNTNSIRKFASFA